MKYCVMWLAWSRLDATILLIYNIWNILPIFDKFDPAYICSTIIVFTSQPKTLISIFKVPKKELELHSLRKHLKNDNKN